ncbi:MAG: hypothetical protein ACK4FE_06165 [Azonexus sp.]
MRPATLALSTLALLALGTAALLVPPSQDSAAKQKLADKRALVEKYGLTDLALFTEARYTRHPSQADLHSAFQDHPAALEHFPTGSLLAPRPSALKPHEPLAGKTTASD